MLASVSTPFQPGPGVTLSQGSAHFSQHLLLVAQQLLGHTKAAAPVTQVTQQLSQRGIPRFPGIMNSFPLEHKPSGSSLPTGLLHMYVRSSCLVDLRQTPPLLSSRPLDSALSSWVDAKVQGRLSQLASHASSILGQAYTTEVFLAALASHVTAKGYCKMLTVSSARSKLPQNVSFPFVSKNFQEPGKCCPSPAVFLMSVTEGSCTHTMAAYGLF